MANDLIREYINRFFDSKKINIIIKVSDVEFVKKTRIASKDGSSGISDIYDSLDHELRDADIKKVLGLLTDCSRLGIPKKYSAGIIILYLEMAEEMCIRYDF